MIIGEGRLSVPRFVVLDERREDLEPVAGRRARPRLNQGPDPQSRTGLPPWTATLPAYFGVIFVILLPWMPSPAISPFWPKTNA